jgi:hypothetical protein
MDPSSSGAERNLQAQRDYFGKTEYSQSHNSEKQKYRHPVAISRPASARIARHRLGRLEGPLFLVRAPGVGL